MNYQWIIIDKEGKPYPGTNASNACGAWYLMHKESGYFETWRKEAVRIFKRRGDRAQRVAIVPARAVQLVAEECVTKAIQKKGRKK